MNRFIIIIFTILIFTFYVKMSAAEVLFVEAEIAGVNNLVNELTVPATSGEEGDFEIFACVTRIDSPNSFSNATPNWNNFNLGECGGPNCILGIFTKFSPEPNNVDSTCFWDNPTRPSVGTVLRYRGVDGSTPITASACTSGIGGFATSPSLNTNPGSLVVRIFGANENFSNEQFNNLPGNSEFGKTQGVSNFESTTANLFTYGEPFPNGGLAEEVSLDYEVVDTAWRACTIVLAMPSASAAQVPTLSEWGLIAMAGILGLVGFMVISRRKLIA
jgi:hypothetical protein